MTTTYAEVADLAARLSPGYTMPSDDDALKLLVKASELIEYVTLGRSEIAWQFAEDNLSDDNAQARKAKITDATCDQVEFWLEVGEEHDTASLPKHSSLQGGRVQVQKIPGQLGRRPMRTLTTAGLMWAGVPSS